MTESGIVHVQRERRTEPFWFAAALFALTFLFALVLLLVLGPVLLLLEFRNPWLLFLLVVVALGLLLLVKTVELVRNLLWVQRHRSVFVLHEAGIETTEWNLVGADSPVRRVIPLEDVSSVVASYRILRRTFLIENGGGVLTETGPVLHVLFDRDGRRQVAGVPFSSHKDPGVDVWIEELRARGVALRYTARMLSWKHENYLGDEARLEYFATTEEVIPFPDRGGWLENTTRLENRWHQLTEKLREQAELRDPALKEARLRPTLRDWIFGAWLAGMYALGTGYLLQYLAQQGTLPPGAWPLGLGVVLPAAALFFLPLRRNLRWYHGVACWFLLVVIAFVSVVSAVEAGPGAEQMGVALFAVAVLSPALLWIPYLGVKRMGPGDLR